MRWSLTHRHGESSRCPYARVNNAPSFMFYFVAVFRCYPVGLTDVQHQSANAVIDRSSAEDESWNGSDSSCSDCSASISSTPCHGNGTGPGTSTGEKCSKVGKRSSQYRGCGGVGGSKKRKKKLRNEQSQRHSALVRITCVRRYDWERNAARFCMVFTREIFHLRTIVKTAKATAGTLRRVWYICRATEMALWSRQQLLTVITKYLLVIWYDLRCLRITVFTILTWNIRPPKK